MTRRPVTTLKPDMRRTRIQESLRSSAARIGRMVRRVGRISLFGLLGLVGTWLAPPSTVFGQTIADYTSVPHFLQENVPANVLFVLDFSDGMLQASYGNYPMSGAGLISSNINGTKLCNTNTDTATNPQPAGCPAANAPADIFDRNTEYFGVFSSLRCYTGNKTIFDTPTVKASISSNCNGAQWDGNFLNWVTTRKLDAAKKVIIGGKSLAAANTDGTVNSLLAEDKTGAGGTNDDCSVSSKPCFRFVKRASGETRPFLIRQR